MSPAYSDRESHCREYCKHHYYPVHPQRDVHISESRTMYCSRAAEQQVILLEEKVHSDHQEKQHSDYYQLFFCYRHQHFQVLIIERLARSRWSFEAASGLSCKRFREFAEHAVQVVESVSGTALCLRLFLFFINSLRLFFKDLRRSHRQQYRIVDHCQHCKCDQQYQHDLVHFFYEVQLECIEGNIHVIKGIFFSKRCAVYKLQKIEPQLCNSEKCRYRTIGCRMSPRYEIQPAVVHRLIRRYFYEIPPFEEFQINVCKECDYDKGRHPYFYLGKKFRKKHRYIAQFSEPHEICDEPYKAQKQS